MPGLAKGVAYHVRVSAYNGVALSYGKTAPSIVPVVRPGEAPEPPSRVEVEAFSLSSLAISWAPPNDAMGADVASYQVVSERERLSIKRGLAVLLSLAASFRFLEGGFG